MPLIYIGAILADCEHTVAVKSSVTSNRESIRKEMRIKRRLGGT